MEPTRGRRAGDVHHRHNRTNADTREIHDRMPVILGADAVKEWLNPAAPPEALQSVLRPAPDGMLTRYRVSTIGELWTNRLAGVYQARGHNLELVDTELPNWWVLLRSQAELEVIEVEALCKYTQRDTYDVRD
ncbi:MAG TPA: SOS response-associated peptidase family protein [Verrucomicrobiota bacterium]|nr:SOS response-associated peptidase family protein [Verrucomicrobiota bacterium]